MRFDLAEELSLTAAHDQEAARQVDQQRAAMVPRRRHQHQVSDRTRRAHLGRVGGRARRSRAGLRPSVALMAGARRRHDRPDRERDRDDQEEPGLAAVDRDGLESGRRREDGVAAVSPAVPVLCRGGLGLLPALPAVGRYVPRLPVQHRVLRRCRRHDGRAGDRLQTRRLRVDRRRHASLSRSPQAVRTFNCRVPRRSSR